MYTYMSICIYIKQKNTVTFDFMCNTFCGCPKMVVSSTLLCWGTSSMLLDVAWSWQKGRCYQHISHLTLIFTQTHSDSHKKKTKKKTYQGDSSLPTSSTEGWLETNFYPWKHTHQCHYSSTHTQSCCHPRSYFINSFVSILPLDGMCLFSAFSANLDVNATLKINNKEKKRIQRVGFWVVVEE